MSETINGLRLTKAATGPKMNREQRRAFMKYLRTPEGLAEIERVKAEHVAKAQADAAKVPE